MSAVEDEARAFVKALDDLYGLYLDAITGFVSLGDELEKSQRTASAQLQMSLDSLDQLAMFIGRGNPNKPGSVLYHATTQGQYKDRNAKDGPNAIYMAQVLVVLIYEYWENVHRHRIASAIGLQNSSDLKTPIMGDIRLLRHDILHRQGIVDKVTVSKLQVVQGLQPGGRVELSEVQVESLVRAVKAGLDALIFAKTGHDPEYRTFAHLLKDTQG